MTANRARNWQLVRHTETALRTGNESLGNVPALLRSLLEEEAWREFSLPSGEAVSYGQFGEFVAASPPRGLGAELGLVERIVGTGDPDLLRLLKLANVRRSGPKREDERPVESTGNSYGRDRSDATAERLAREAPERYAAVKSGELSINAAAVLAGIRPRRISVRTDDPASVARSLRKHMAPAALAVLRALLDD